MKAQQEHEKLFNITNYQGPEKQNYTCQKGYYEKKNKKINASEDRKKK